MDTYQNMKTHVASIFGKLPVHVYSYVNNTSEILYEIYPILWKFCIIENLRNSKINDLIVPNILYFAALWFIFSYAYIQNIVIKQGLQFEILHILWFTYKSSLKASTISSIKYSYYIMFLSCLKFFQSSKLWWISRSRLRWIA